MNPFTYSRPTSVNEAVNLSGAATRFIAGGTNLLDLMKENVARPEHLIDITRLPLNDISETADGGLLIGALVSNADLAWNPLIEQRYSLLSQAVLAGASPQLRNMASTGGNLLQRTRCYYFYDSTVPCNKREPGSGCPARDGLNRIHAILGASDECVATHPSDMCVALAALDAVVHVQGRAGQRTIEFADFHRLPGDAPQRDNQLADDELITAVELPAPSFAGQGKYLKIRDRASYAFALISVAASIELDGDVIRDVRLALGGVAHKPWRDKVVEQMLVGKPVSRENFAAAADALLADAEPLEHNAFKVKLARRAIIRTLSDAAVDAAATGVSAR